MTVRNFNFSKLTLEHRESCIKLFVECFKTSYYYKQLFSTHIEQDLENIARMNIDYIINDQLSYVTLNNNNEVVAFVWNIDYKKLKTNPIHIAKLFSGSSNVQDNPYYNKIDDHISKFDSVIYILDCCVAQEYRNNKIASALIEKTLQDNKDKTIACDVISPHMLKICSTNNFKITEIEKDYHLCIHNS